MNWKFAALALTLIACLSTNRSEASTLDYNLALSATNGPESGSGSFAVSGPIAANGLSVFTSTTGLDSLRFSIDGYTFSLANELSNASVTFDNGKLTSIAYLGASNGFQLDLGTRGLNYAFLDFTNLGLSSAGTISASATPLPPTWTLMLTGLAAFGFWAYRRKPLQTA
jgi:hypothetical protein